MKSEPKNISNYGMAAILALGLTALGAAKPEKPLIKDLKEYAAGIRSNTEQILCKDTAEMKSTTEKVEFLFDPGLKEHPDNMVNVTVDRDGGILSYPPFGGWICRDEDLDGVWEVVTGGAYGDTCDSGNCGINPDVHYTLKDKQERPKKWKELQKLCNDRVRYVLTRFRDKITLIGQLKKLAPNIPKGTKDVKHTRKGVTFNNLEGAFNSNSSVRVGNNGTVKSFTHFADDHKWVDCLDADADGCWEKGAAHKKHGLERWLQVRSNCIKMVQEVLQQYKRYKNR